MSKNWTDFEVCKIALDGLEYDMKNRILSAPKGMTVVDVYSRVKDHWVQFTPFFGYPWIFKVTSEIVETGYNYSIVRDAIKMVDEWTLRFDK